MGKECDLVKSMDANAVVILSYLLYAIDSLSIVLTDDLNPYVFFFPFSPL